MTYLDAAARVAVLDTLTAAQESLGDIVREMNIRDVVIAAGAPDPEPTPEAPGPFLWRVEELQSAVDDLRELFTIGHLPPNPPPPEAVPDDL